MKKKILFVTTTRADYGKLKPLIVGIQKNKKFISKVFVTGMHNLKLYGSTYGELLTDHIKGIYIHKNQTKFSKMDEILIKYYKADRTNLGPLLHLFIKCSQSFFYLLCLLDLL